jgi:hypothetical protein
MRNRLGGWTIAVIVATSIVTLALPASSQAAASCAPPRGPGDKIAHSKSLRARGVGCRTARQVVLASTKGSRRFSEGAPFEVAGYTWRCYASPFPDSHQRCTAPSGKAVAIIWTD